MPRPDWRVASEQPQAGLVGRRFLGAALAQQRAHQHVVAAHGQAAAGAGDIARRFAAGKRAADHQPDAQDGEQQALGRVARDPAAQRSQVAADDMAGLVGDHTDHLVGRLGLHEGAGVDEHVVAVHHEGVEAFVPDDAHGDVLRAEAGGLEDRDRIVLEKVFDLRVADQRQVLRSGRRDGGDRGRDGVDRGQRCRAPARGAARSRAWGGACYRG